MRIKVSSLKGIILILIILMNIPTAVASHLYVTLEPITYQIDPVNNPDLPPYRLPGFYFWEKTESGQVRSDINEPILQYEIRDNTGSCLCSAETEEEFIKYLSCLRGTYTVWLITEDIIYIGQITIS